MASSPPGPAIRFSHDRRTEWLQLKQRVEQHLRETGDVPRADARHLMKCVLLFLLMAITWGALIHFGGDHPWLTYFAFFMAAMLLAVNVMHDASHNAILDGPRANRWLMIASSAPLGLDATIWAVRHVRHHHVHANIEGRDLDIEPNPLLRQTPFQRWAPRFRFQHLYWPVMAAISLPYLVWYLDWKDQFGRSPLASDAQIRSARQRAIFLAGKAVHIALVLGVPCAVLAHAGVSVPVTLAAYLCGQLLASLIVVNLLLGTHWADAEFFDEPADGALPHPWHEHATRTACDWVPRPRWLAALLGGLNWHLTHHLFPGHHHRHYRALAPLVQQWAQEHGLRYRCLRYSELLRAQQAFLRKLGQPPE